MPQLLISWQRDREGEREGGGKRERERERERGGGANIICSSFPFIVHYIGIYIIKGKGVAVVIL